MLFNPAGYEYDEIFAELSESISGKSYPGISQALCRHTGVFTRGQAWSLFEGALDNELTLEAVEDILNHCPPVPEILLEFGVEDTYCGMGFAAASDRPDVMTLLLERGASPNHNPRFHCSPLEAALCHCSLNSVKLLLEQPDLDTAWTEDLLMYWARPHVPNSVQEACNQAMASRFTGWDPLSGQPMPIPEPMTAEIIVKVWNQPLLERFCRERGPISLKDGLHAIRTFSPGYLKFHCQIGENDSNCAGIVATLFKYCPHLLRKEEACRVLLRCFLRFGEDERARLRPWAERLRRRRIAMERKDWLDGKYGGYTGFLEQWQMLFPQGPALEMDRWSDILEYFYWEEEAWKSLRAETLSRILSACSIRGGGRKGKLSPLAQAVLCRGDVPLIESLLARPHGLLAAEDPDALMAYVREENCPCANRAALAHVRKEVSYDL